MGAGGGRAIGQAPALNTTLTQLDLYFTLLKEAGGRSIGQALALNRVLTNLYLSYNDMGAKGARKIGQALQVNRVLTTLHLKDGNTLAGETRREIKRRALNTKLLAVMMPTRARLGADIGLKVLKDHLVTLICDLFCTESKMSSLFGKAGVRADGVSSVTSSATSSAGKARRHLSLARPASSPAPATITSSRVLLQMQCCRRKRLAMCASRACRSGRKCFLAGRVTGMAAPTAVLRRSVRADGVSSVTADETQGAGAQS